MRQELRRAGLRHRQARQSLRRGDRRDSPLEAYRKAFATDPTSAFGGIIAFNRALDARDRRGDQQAVRRSDHRARACEPAAREFLAAKQNLRVLEVPLVGTEAQAHDFKRVGGGLLVQSPDLDSTGPNRSGG